MIKKIIFGFSLYFFFIGFVNAQEKDDFQIATSFFNEKRYDKAAKILGDIYAQGGKKRETYFSMYRTALFRSQQFDTLIVLLRQEIPNRVDPFQLELQLFECYLKKEKKEVAYKIFDASLQKVKNDKAKIKIAVSVLFRNYQFSKVTDVIELSRDFLHDPNLLYNDYVNALIYQRDFASATKELIRLYNQRQKDYSSMSALVLSYASDRSAQIPTMKVLEDTKQSNYPVDTKQSASKLMSSIFLEMGAYKLALREARYQDATANRDGTHTLLFAHKALGLGKKAVRVAKNAYQDVLRTTRVPSHVKEATLGLARIERELLRELDDSTKSRRAPTTIRLFLEYLKENPGDKNEPEILYEVALMQAEYLNDRKQAIAYLKTLIGKYPYASQSPKATILFATLQAQLGNVKDAYFLLRRVITRSSLKSNIGAEAQLQITRLAFYDRNFVKALTGLSVIPPKTTAANDALIFRVLLNKAIDDTSRFDKAIEALESYADIEKAIFKKEDSRKVTSLFSYWQETFQESNIAEDVLYRKADYERKARDTLNAIKTLSVLSERYPEGNYADKAIYTMGTLLEKKAPKKAEKQYEKILTDFPKSLYKYRARERLLHLSEGL